MDVYGSVSAPDFFRIDDLLDFSNDELFSSTTAAAADSDLHHLPSPENKTTASAAHFHNPNPIHHSTDFTDDLCVPNDDIAELEWLSNFVDDSFTDFPKNELAVIGSFRPDTSSHGRSRSKRSRAASAKKSWTSSLESETPIVGKPKTNTTNSNGAKKRESSSSASAHTGDRDRSSSSSTSQSVARRCTHCQSEKTPQWRTGPLGPKTLCNACGVRYKSGRLVPEYRPAASPTFVLTQHSNSHRKVIELRRQKELREQQEEQFYHRDFEVC
ncbi:GATA transcription factor 4-like [Cornus florida]|uniref:GATA transcription factor 4-like n=1 Tax=Cornus florida TaxID=4283 RepID=UPI0028A2CBC3|nr:GATA transcription factor 4-like [Cornus florida]